MNTSDPTNAAANPSKEKRKDYGNFLCTVMFFSLMVTSLLSHDWLHSIAWGCLAAGFALMIRSAGIRGREGIKPSALAASFLVLAGVLLISVAVLGTMIARH